MMENNNKGRLAPFIESGPCSRGLREVKEPRKEVKERGSPTERTRCVWRQKRVSSTRVNSTAAANSDESTIPQPICSQHYLCFLTFGQWGEWLRKYKYLNLYRHGISLLGAQCDRPNIKFQHIMRHC